MGKITDSIISGSTGRVGRVVVANVNEQEFKDTTDRRCFPEDLK